MADERMVALACSGQAAGPGGAAEGSASGGGRAAPAAILTEHQERIGGVVWRLLGWADAEVEDVVQDVLAVAVEKLPRFRGEASLATWLTAIAVNKCRSVQRRRLVQQKFLSLLHLRRGAEGPAASDIAAGREREEKVRRSIRRLPGRLREAVVLRYLEEMSVDDVAAALGISRTATTTRLHRARQLLAKELGELIED